VTDRPGRQLETWVDGRLVPAQDATVSAFDRGFRSGEGVFETFRAYGGHVFRLDAHIDRARSGAEILGFDVGGHDELAAAVSVTAQRNLEAHEGRDSALRLTATPGRIDPTSAFPGSPVEGPTIVVTSHPLAVPRSMHRDGTRAVSLPLARELPHVKTLSHLMALTARRRARAEGADEALLTDAAGDVLEGTSTNVFAVIDGALVTPPVHAGLLAGVTRAVAFDVAARLGLAVDERPLPLEALFGADEAFLTATTREIIPLVHVDATTIGSGRPGRITRRVHAGFREEVERERATKR